MMPKINVKKKKVNIHIAGSRIKEPANRVEITPSEEEQIFAGLYNEVIVDKINTEEIEPKINFEASNSVDFVANAGKYIKKVTINKDENLIPENLQKGLNIYGVIGTANVGNLNEYFYEDIVKTQTRYDIATLIKKIPVGLKAPVDCTNLFSYYPNVIGNVEKMDFSEVEKFGSAFLRSAVLGDKDLDLSKSNKVTTYNSAFYDCKLNNLTVNFESATNISAMFENAKCSGKVTIIGKPKATSLSAIFRSFQIEEAPYFDTSEIQDTRQMFYGANKIKRIPLYDFSSVNSFDYTFYFSTTNSLEYMAGFANVGKGYDPANGANYSKYTIPLSPLSYSIDSFKTLKVEDSILNVIENLYDIASAGIPTQKLSLGNSIIKHLTPEQIAVATNKGWTVV